MKNNKPTIRSGFTVLELIVTTAMLAMLTTACMVVVRTSYSAWNRHNDEHAQRQAGLDVLQHIVRTTRQARAVSNISLASDNSGTLTLLDISGNLLVWKHDSGSSQVQYGIGSASNLLATGVEELNFVGYKVDGLTATTDPGLIHSIQCTSKVNVSRPAGAETITTTCRAWLRSW